jgi:hypothetical protein
MFGGTPREHPRTALLLFTEPGALLGPSSENKNVECAGLTRFSAVLVEVVVTTHGFQTPIGTRIAVLARDHTDLERKRCFVPLGFL